MSDSHGSSILELKSRIERGDTFAMSVLGKKYYEGDGVDKDIDMAVELMKLAADGGQKEAEYTYGYFCCYGIGVPTDKIQAIKWYRKSANQGYTEAQYGLGYMCDFGEGIEVNKMEAAK